MSDTKEEIEDWVNQVYYGNCCSHPDEEDKKLICLSSASKDDSEKV